MVHKNLRFIGACFNPPKNSRKATVSQTPLDYSIKQCLQIFLAFFFLSIVRAAFQMSPQSFSALT